MQLERLIWVAAVLAVGGIAFFGGQQYGVQQAAQQRSQAQQQFLRDRGGAAQGGQGGQGVAGAVSAVSADGVALTTRDGRTVTVKLAANGVVRRQVDGALTDIKVGDQVFAIGQQSGDAVQASVIQVGGFGGRAGAPPAQAP